jgi:hypothetical protein
MGRVTDRVMRRHSTRHNRNERTDSGRELTGDEQIAHGTALRRADQSFNELNRSREGNQTLVSPFITASEHREREG